MYQKSIYRKNDPFFISSNSFPHAASFRFPPVPPPSASTTAPPHPTCTTPPLTSALHHGATHSTQPATSGIHASARPPSGQSGFVCDEGDSGGSGCATGTSALAPTASSSSCRGPMARTGSSTPTAVSRRDRDAKAIGG
ncbi:hypothetical protein PVAP13_9NG311173 [Panicum virgatum]|uniref:Uncharacterized protein n=1 Tax=Panicum virgatum TaxID=38727 RepID=A0A8T0MSF1_PANVG|nr:hypothetical protein PVAP13_9NG311173 [Panicum virgatum]